MKRIPDFLITAARVDKDKLLVRIDAPKSKEDVTLCYKADEGEEFDDEYFEDAKTDIAAMIIEKAMHDSGKPFHKLDIVVGFNAPQFDNIELDFVPPEDEEEPLTPNPEP